MYIVNYFHLIWYTIFVCLISQYAFGSREYDLKIFNWIRVKGRNGTQEVATDLSVPKCPNFQFFSETTECVCLLFAKTDHILSENG